MGLTSNTSPIARGCVAGSLHIYQLLPLWVKNFYRSVLVHIGFNGLVSPAYGVVPNTRYHVVSPLQFGARYVYCNGLYVVQAEAVEIFPTGRRIHGQAR